MEDTLAELALAAVFFLATHVGMSSTPIRAALVGVLSEKGFLRSIPWSLLPPWAG